MTEEEVEKLLEGTNPQSPILRIMLIAFAALVIIAIVWVFSTGRLP